MSEELESPREFHYIKERLEKVIEGGNIDLIRYEYDYYSNAVERRHDNLLKNTERSRYETRYELCELRDELFRLRSASIEITAVDFSLFVDSETQMFFYNSLTHADADHRGTLDSISWVGFENNDRFYEKCLPVMNLWLLCAENFKGVPQGVCFDTIPECRSSKTIDAHLLNDPWIGVVSYRITGLQENYCWPHEKN